MEQILQMTIEQLEAMLGQTGTGAIGVFVVTIIIVPTVSRILVTSSVLRQAVTKMQEQFEAKIARINAAIADTKREMRLETIRLRMDLLREQLDSLEEKIDTQGSPPTIAQHNRLEEIRQQLHSLQRREEELTLH
jgi:hypothetical protein